MNPNKRSAVIAGNWKMNLTRPQAKALIEEMKPLVAEANCGVILCVPFTDLETAIAAASGSNIKIGAQNCHWAESGAFTGEVSPAMLTELGAEYVILGHSERRQYFGDTDETVNKRLLAALEAGLKVILCVGETLSQREEGKTQEVLSRQTTAALAGVSSSQLANIIIAYEPIWAIGTGKTATAAQAGEGNAAVRATVASLYGEEAAEALTIQYGGSMKASNAAELLAQPDVDGGLIGGASLKAADFAAIVQAASR